MEDLEESILLMREAVHLCPPGHPHYSTSLGNLAGFLITQYNQLGKMEDLEESIVLGREVLHFHPPGHPDRSRTLGNLSISLRTQYSRLGKMEDLKESVLLMREAVHCCPSSHPQYSISLGNLASSLSTQYDQLGKIEDLEESIVLGREVLHFYPPGHPDRSRTLGSLGISLSTRYNQFGKMEDLEESILLQHEALYLCPPGHADRSKLLGNLADSLHTRYVQLGKIEDLEESILLMHKALDLCPPGHPDHSTSLGNLASSLISRYKQFGKMEDLEESILLEHEALQLCPPGHPDHSKFLGNLAGSLSTRYNQLGKMEDLEQSILLLRKAIHLYPPGHPDHFRSLGRLAGSLITQYEQLGKMEDLEESILLIRKALHLCPFGHPARSTSLRNLAVFLLIQYNQLGRMEDLEESILLTREALHLCPPGHPARSTSLGCLAISLSVQYIELGNIENLEEAILLMREALHLCPPGHLGRSRALANLASALSTRYDKLGNSQDFEEMFTLSEQAASDHTSHLKDRLDAAVSWAEMAQQYNHQSALNAYTNSSQLLYQSFISRSNVEEQHLFLAANNTPQSLPSDAASAAIQAGNLELAVEFLEQGRAMLWSRVEGYKSPLEQLRQVEPDGGELAEKFETLSAQLERCVLLSDRMSAVEELPFDAQIKQHRILSEQWDDLVGRIQQKEGFAHFLKTPAFGTLQSAAAEGPVILINISEYRSDAIILTLNNPPSLITLPDVNVDDLQDQADRLTSDRGITGVLRYLWYKIVSPVVAGLDKLGVEQESRIWWCPTAELCALPLHAAGPYCPRQPNLPDIYTSSYTSTLSALIRARSNIVQQPGPPKLLIVGQPHATLERVGDEVAIIKQQLDVVDVLLGAEASHEAVLAGLKQHEWVHFACHGHLGDNDQPFRASFELHDGRRLTLLELIQARLPNAESAFLAACHSAAGDSRTPDESIHLAAALQFCGFRSVVGTLWEMIDDDGPMMSKQFYKYMFRDPTKIDFRDSARALNLAVRAMKKAKLGPEHWAMFVHIGA